MLKIRDLSVHYAKKGDLLYPQLKVKYGISGASDVMWTVDDEIRDDLGILMKESPRSADWNTRLDGVLKRAEEMIYKEQNILFSALCRKFYRRRVERYLSGREGLCGLLWGRAGGVGQSGECWTK